MATTAPVRAEMVSGHRVGRREPASSHRIVGPRYPARGDPRQLGLVPPSGPMTLTVRWAARAEGTPSFRGSGLSQPAAHLLGHRPRRLLAPTRAAAPDHAIGVEHHDLG